MCYTQGQLFKDVSSSHDIDSIPIIIQSPVEILKIYIATNMQTRCPQSEESGTETWEKGSAPDCEITEKRIQVRLTESKDLWHMKGEVCHCYDY